jgi:WD40 repeat protein
MSYTVHTSDINSLIYQYLLERGLHHSAFLLKHEVKEELSEVPAGSLISFLEKSLVMEELQHHRNESVRPKQESLTNGYSRCLNEFRLNHAHDCLYKPEENTSNGHVDEVKTVVLLDGHSATVSLLESWKGSLISGYFLLSGKDGTVRLWRFKQEISSFELFGILPHLQPDKRTCSVEQLEVNQFGALVSRGSDGVVRIWTAEGRLSNTIQASEPILSAEWDSSGHFILTSCRASLELWDKEGTHQHSFLSPQISDILKSISRSPNEFTVQSKSGVFSWRQNEDPQMLYPSKTERIKWSPTKTFLAMQEGVNIAIYQDDYELWWLNRDNSAFEFTFKGNSLASGSIFGDVFLWDLDRRNIYLRVPVSITRILKLSLRKDDEFIAVQGEDEVQLCCLSDLNVIRKVRGLERIQQW